jgi:hypothetical protein
MIITYQQAEELINLKKKILGEKVPLDNENKFAFSRR